MKEWTVHVQGGSVPGGSRLGLDVNPHRRTVTLAPFEVGMGSAEVGQLVVYRVFFAGEANSAAEEWLRGPEARALMEQVSAGYSSYVVWSGDRIGEWTEDAWGAAEGLAEGVDKRL